METGDTGLALAAAKGDRAAFADLLSRQYDRIFRVAFGVLGNRADAEDLAQDVCAALPAKLRSFDGRARFSTWIYTVTVNAARDMIRRRSTGRRHSETWGERETLLRAEQAQSRDEVQWLADSMTCLNDELRETLALVLGEDLTHATAAQVLGISAGTVSWRMSEVKRILRDRHRKDLS